MNCKFGCKKELKSLSNSFLPLFRHIDYSTIKSKLNYKVCNNCGSVFNLKLFNKESKIFSEKIFLDSKQTISSINHDKGKNLFRHVIQANIISKLKSGKRLNFLDYGCFDGKLLIELHKKNKDSSFYGIDKSPNFKKIFPNKKNFHYHTNIDEIKKKFDVVIFSDSLYYLNNAKKILEKVNEILKPDGFLFLQNTDLQKNPYYILNGDQYFFAFDEPMKHLLNLTKFKIIKKNFKVFKKQNIYICKKKKSTNLKKINKKNYYSIYKRILKKLEDKYNFLKKNNSVKYIFGTTVNAAFADEAIGKNTIFIDENIEKIQHGFRNKKVINPKEVEKGETIILNYSKNNKIYKNILKKKYKINVKEC